MLRACRALRLAPLLLLAACASVPTPRPKIAAVPKNTVVTPPALFTPQQTQDRLDDALDAQHLAGPGMVWTQLRESFAMHDCDADPSIAHWAKRYTRNAQGLQQRLREALPKIAYVQQVSADYGVPGEFALLPWVESRYRVAADNRTGSAGTWQITPRTARDMGLAMNPQYDARLDLQASSAAVMKLLKRYQQRFADWRLVAYAYNAGEFATARFVDTLGKKSHNAPIPKWSGHAGTQQHLSQLLAIACVVRNPGRFGVVLPGLSADRRLTSVAVDGTLALTTVAQRAAMPIDELKSLNAGILDGVVDSNSGASLLLPSRQARRFDAAPGRASPDAAIADRRSAGGG